VYQLKKALYGLKQASLAWNKQAHASLQKLGFKCCLSNTGVYIHCQKSKYVIVVLYVDDILFLGNNHTLVLSKKKEFMKIWECRDLGRATEFLGMNIGHGSDHKGSQSIFIDQMVYAHKIVECFGMLNAKHVRTLLPAGYIPVKNTGPKDPALKQKYQQAIGSLLYLMLGTWPDLSFAVITMSQFSSNPSLDHWNQVMYIF